MVINESTVISEMILMQIVYKSKAKPVVISKSLSLLVIKKLLQVIYRHMYLLSKAEKCKYHVRYVLLICC